MTKLWSPYVNVVVETYYDTDPSRSIRVRPIPGQVFPPTINVECSRAMRMQHPVGTRFRIRAKLTDKEGGRPFLYTRYSWRFDLVRDGTI